MSLEPPIPETRVLAVASHVVYGYVGNTMATFIMQALGCEVSALNTVQLSNHVAYGHFTGTRTSAAEIRDLWAGMKKNDLADFDILLSGFAPSAEAVAAVGAIGKELKLKASMKPGSFFWVLDPVMGDEGELYVDESVVPVYKTLMPSADLLIPNLFELETLTNTKIPTPAALAATIAHLHAHHQIPHILITSVNFPSHPSHPSQPPQTISVIGSSKRSDHNPRLFKIDIPALDCFFSGTGDFFAALTIVRLREAAVEDGLCRTEGWLSEDGVEAVSLPLARAVERVLASMCTVLGMVKEGVDAVVKGAGEGVEQGEGEEERRRRRLRKTRAAEVSVIRHLGELREPKVMFRAEPLGV